MFTAAELAGRIGARVVGDGTLKLVGVASLDAAGANHLSFFANSKYAGQLQKSAAGAVIVSDERAAPDKVQLVCADAYLGLRGALLAFHRLTPEITPGISSQAVVDSSAIVDSSAQVGPGAVLEANTKVGANSFVGAGCFLGRESVVGDDCYLYPHVTVYHHVRIGDRVIIHSGVVLGADGFGYARSKEGALKIPQVGGVLIGDDVEIGANTTIDRATLGDTKVGKGTKIDNLVMIAHNVEIGEHCLIVAQAGIAGSTRLGNGVIVAGQVGIIGHLDIGDAVTIGAQSGVAHDLVAGKTYLGSPARDLGEEKRIIAYLSKLPEWAKRLRALEDTIAHIKA